MELVITRNPNVMHGTPCFAGTRVAARTFFDHLEDGYTINGFLEQFPTVRREQVIRLIERMREDEGERSTHGTGVGRTGGTSEVVMR